MKSPIRVLELSGSPYEIGFAHGSTYRQDIRRYTADRIDLVMAGTWSGGVRLSRQEVLDLAEACLPAHRDYAPDLFEEMRGLAAATGLSPAELVITSGFTDFVDTVFNRYPARASGPSLAALDDCTAFIVPDGRAQGAGFLGQTWDMHDTATEFVIMLRLAPNAQPAAMVFTTTGCLGQIGMNEHGLAIGINNLAGADGGVGVTWPFVIRKALQQETAEQALDCILEAPLAGAHNYLIFDRHGHGYNVEGMTSRSAVTPLEDIPLIHTNHCLLPDTLAVAQEKDPDIQARSEARLDAGRSLLQAGEVTINDLQDLTRQDPICVRSQPPYHVESCGAAIMRPKNGDFWAVWGLPAENEYEHFKI